MLACKRVKAGFEILMTPSSVSAATADIDAVIFDCDGVILDSEPIHYHACQPFFTQKGVHLTYEDYLTRYVGLSDKEMFPLILQDYNIPFTPQEIWLFMAQKSAAYAGIVGQGDDLPLVGGVEQFMQQLFKQDKRMAVCSGGARKEVHTVLAQLKNNAAEKYFETIVTAEDVRQGKPSPEGYLLTAERMNVDPRRCLVFEDTPHGIEAAQNAGMRVIGVLTTHPREDLRATEEVIKDFFELLDK